MKKPTESRAVKSGTYKEFSYRELTRNPQNPRRLFDEEPLKVLRESIRANGILVPLTVYFQESNKQHYILDGERRWMCAEEIENDPKDPKKVPIPANVVAPPSPVANILWMFNIHNLREQWDLMPTALSLKIVMDKLGETDDEKLAELTKLSVPNVRRCKILLSYRQKYQEKMLAIDPAKRVRANFFIEMSPVLGIYMSLPSRVRGGKSRNDLIDHFLNLYDKGKIPSVIHFRRVLEAYDSIKEDGKVNQEKEELFLDRASTLATSDKQTIRHLFDPLTAESKIVGSAEDACKDFLATMRKLKPAHVVKRVGLRKALLSVKAYVDDLLTKLEGQG